MTTEERIAQIAQGFGQGIQNYQQGQDRLRSQELQDTARRRQEALQALEVSSQLSQQTGRQIDPSAIQPFLQSGNLSGINDILSSGEMTPQAIQRAEQARIQKQMQDLDMQQKQAQLKELNAPFGESREAQKLAFQEGLKQKKEMGDKKELEIPGLGFARTKQEAVDIRNSMSDAEDAAKIIDRIKTLGKNIGPFDRKRRAELEQTMTVLAGKLRVPLTGPGAMTESEFQRLMGSIGNPASYTSLESTEMAKLDNLKNILKGSIESKIKTAGLTGQGQNIAQQPAQSPNVNFAQVPDNDLMTLRQNLMNQKAQQVQKNQGTAAR